MKNIIFGAGIVGISTGTFLEAHGEDVTYYDIDNKTITKLQKNGKKATEVIPSDWDICWMCTHENQLPKMIPSQSSSDSVIVIRSTVEPDFFDKVDTERVLHMPEFLREKNSLEDTFNPDRIVLGGKENKYTGIVLNLLSDIYVDVDIHIVPQKISSLIKLISNAWLSTQISFWNEMYDILDDHDKFRQIIPDIVTIDKRISKYGTMMLGNPFFEKGITKDLDHLINVGKNPILLKTVREVNNRLKDKIDNEKGRVLA